jgi:hypothetical protein
MLAKDGHGSQDLQRGRVTAAGHDNIRLRALIVARPTPDANSFRAMDDRRLHVQPLGKCVLSGNHDVHVVPELRIGVGSAATWPPVPGRGETPCRNMMLDEPPSMVRMRGRGCRGFTAEPDARRGTYRVSTQRLCQSVRLACRRPRRSVTGLPRVRFTFANVRGRSAG